MLEEMDLCNSCGKHRIMYHSVHGGYDLCEHCNNELTNPEYDDSFDDTVEIELTED